MAYTIIRGLFVIIYVTIFRWDVKGNENIPKTGPFILCSNHISWWDPTILGGLTKRPARYMAKEELFKVPILGTILRMINVFPVKRNSADHKAIKTSLAALEAGGGLGMFPEGTRSRTDELLPPQPGVGFIAVKSKAPVIPVAIIGPFKFLRPLRVRVGKPMTFPEYYDVKVKSEQLEDVAKRIMAEIAILRKSI